MTNFKKVFLLCVTPIIIISMNSCTKKNILEYISIEYYGDFLIHDEFNGDYIEYICKKYGGDLDIFYVSQINGKLRLDKSEILQNTTLTFRAGVLTGMDCGEFAGWVKYTKYTTNIEETITIINDNFRGFIKIDDNLGYVLTGLNHLSTKRGALYKLSVNDNSELNCELVIDLESCPYSFYIDENKLYILQYNRILEIDSYSKSNVVVSFQENMSQLGFGGITKLNDTIYVGIGGGVYSINICLRYESKIRRIVRMKKTKD